ncbi:peptidoglycan-binding protein [Actinoplanes sp. NPDC051859]|uniref:peptidoglycan-binding protein n=1 Tax=Actinoplanes sp. NPDC051859 TaxID=3363909 RepID=UPI0037B7ED3B
MRRTILAAATLVALTPGLLGAVPAQAGTPALHLAAVQAAASDGWPTVNQGDKGADVTAIQYLLNHYGYATDTDGIFGPNTDTNVKKFQSAKGLTADGDVGPLTWAKLVVQVKEGGSGNAVKAAQTQLKANGYSVDVDGKFGPDTAKETKAFQKKAGLDQDGIIGPNTWRALVNNAGDGNNDGGGGGGTRADLAKHLRDDPDSVLLTTHVSGNNHSASTARSNIVDTAAGRAAKTSPWSDVGVQSVTLNINMLRGMVKLDTERGYSYRVTAIAGGDHSSNSRHYRGRAFDVDTINGRRVGSGADHSGFMAACRAYGATEVLGPGSAGHSTHVHCAW